MMDSVLKKPTKKNIPIKEQILASQRKLIFQFLFNIYFCIKIQPFNI
jgi:hypothetical protein